MISGTSADDRWQRLGAKLIQRRTQINPRFHNRGAFCEATGLNYRLVYDIEEARRTNFGGPVLAAIEVAYQLEPGAIHRFLAGAGDLEPQPGTALLPPPAAQPLRPDIDFAAAEDPADLEPYIQSFLARAYAALKSIYGDDDPPPLDDPGITGLLFRVPGRRVFPGDDRRSRRYADLWEDSSLKPKERLDLLAEMHLYRDRHGQQDSRRTGLRALVPVAGAAYRASS